MRRLEADVVVVGGGSTGAGVVRDVAMRGELLRRVPVERTLSLQRLGQVAEQGQVRERIERGLAPAGAGVVIGHDGMLRPGPQ